MKLTLMLMLLAVLGLAQNTTQTGPTGHSAVAAQAKQDAEQSKPLPKLEATTIALIEARARAANAEFQLTQAALEKEYESAIASTYKAGGVSDKDYYIDLRAGVFKKKAPVTK